MDDKFNLAARKLFVNLACEAVETTFWIPLLQRDNAEPAYIRDFPNIELRSMGLPNPPRFGQYSANTSEWTNAFLIVAQEKPMQIGLLEIWHWMLQRTYERGTRTISSTFTGQVAIGRYSLGSRS